MSMHSIEIKPTKTCELEHSKKSLLLPQNQMQNGGYGGHFMFKFVLKNFPKLHFLIEESEN